MKCGPYLRVGEPVAVKAVFDAGVPRIRLDDARHTCGRSPQSARQKSDSVSVLFLICRGSCSVAIARQPLSSTLRRSSPNRPGAYRFPDRFGAWRPPDGSASRCVDVRRVDHAAPPHAAACMRTGRMLVGSTRRVAVLMTRPCACGAATYPPTLTEGACPRQTGQ